MKHTPGTWRAKKSHFVNYNVHFGPFGTIDYCEISGPNSEANAKLIAAAPEMLEILIVLINTSAFLDLSYETREEIKAVIKKATE